MKIVFVLGDSPFFCTNTPYNFQILMHSDIIYVPDTHMREQLLQAGAPRVEFGLMLGIHPNYYDQFIPTDAEKKQYAHDITFVGRSYPNSWGYKRAYFLSHFAEFDLKVYASGRAWDMWLPDFSQLREKTEVIHQRLNDRMMTVITKCSKICPVEKNPGIINGIHMRVFESLLCNVLPITEHTPDIARYFPNAELPAVSCRQEAIEKTRYYLDHDTERQELIAKLKQHLLTEHTVKARLQMLLRDLNWKL